jgi:hypothetical protein
MRALMKVRIKNHSMPEMHSPKNGYAPIFDR